MIERETKNKLCSEKRENKTKERTKHCLVNNNTKVK